MKLRIIVLLFIYYALHQDFWNWNTARPLLFGFLPIGLAYHALYAAGAAALMAFVVKVAWPTELEKWAEQEPGE